MVDKLRELRVGREGILGLGSGHRREVEQGAEPEGHEGELFHWDVV